MDQLLKNLKKLSCNLTGLNDKLEVLRLIIMKSWKKIVIRDRNYHLALKKKFNLHKIVYQRRKFKFKLWMVLPQIRPNLFKKGYSCKKMILKLIKMLKLKFKEALFKLLRRSFKMIQFLLIFWTLERIWLLIRIWIKLHK